MDRLAFKTDRVEINHGAFAAAVLRHMVELKTGPLTNEKYNEAVVKAIRENNLPQRDGMPDLHHKDERYLSSISKQIAENARNCKEKVDAT